MKYGIGTCLLILVMTVAGTVSGEDAMEINMDDFLWKNRPILIFTPSGDHENYQALKSQIQQERAQLTDRDIVVLHLIAEGQSHLDEQPITAQSAERIRERFQPGTEMLTVILVGKDGTEKARKTGFIDITSFYPIIDAMPMRRREMRQQ